jgi:hypothetical protein
MPRGALEKTFLRHKKTTAPLAEHCSCYLVVDLIDLERFSLPADGVGWIFLAPFECFSGV